MSERVARLDNAMLRQAASELMQTHPEQQQDECNFASHFVLKLSPEPLLMPISEAYVSCFAGPHCV